MTPQMRNFYKIERRWKDAEVVDLSHVLAQRRESSTDDEKDSSLGDDTEDPFWT